MTTKQLANYYRRYIVNSLVWGYRMVLIGLDELLINLWFFLMMTDAEIIDYYEG